jgi:hypothetical protein
MGKGERKFREVRGDRGCNGNTCASEGKSTKVAGIAEVRELCKEVRRSMDSAALLDLTLAL